MKRQQRELFFFIFLSTLFTFIASTQQAVGADLFVNPDLFGNCTRSLPCRPHTALLLAAPGDTIYFKQGTYKGEPLATEVIYLSKDINLLGGWNGNPAGDLVRNPELHPSTLDGENLRRVIRVNSGAYSSPTIDGFTITNGNATGLINNCSGQLPNGCGGGIYVDLAKVRILNNKILNNSASLSPNLLQFGYGGGVHLEGSAGAVVRGNLVQGNQAHPGGLGGGGGLSIFGSSAGTRIVTSQFIDNNGQLGGGIMAYDQDDLLIDKNSIRNNHGAVGVGLYLTGTGTITRNHFQNHLDGAAVYLELYQGVFDSNTLITSKIGVELRKGTLIVPRVSNNIIADNGTSALVAEGLGPNPLQVNLEHNTLAGGGSGAAISIPASQYVTLSMTNNIIAGFPTGIVNSSYPSSSVLAHHTLFSPDVSNHGINVNFQNSLTGDPAFMDPATADYHIRFTSAAKDAGSINFIAVKDIDGDPRPIGSAPDIGADEYLPAGYLYLPLIHK